MQPRITAVTLGVRDIAKSRKFYCEGLGWNAAPSSNANVVFIDANGLVLCLFGRAALAEDAHLKVAGEGFGGVALAQNLASKEAVDETMAFVAKAGATITKPAAETFWGGYSGYFTDPDGHAWEVAFNPFWPLDADGRVQLPKY